MKYGLKICLDGWTFQAVRIPLCDEGVRVGWAWGVETCNQDGHVVFRGDRGGIFGSRRAIECRLRKLVERRTA